MKSIPYEPSCEEAAMEELDEHIGQQITIKKSDGPVVVKVIFCCRYDARNLVSKKHTQPQLDTWVYNVKFSDGHFERYSSNILSEGLTESIDPDGYQVGFIKEICGYRADDRTAVLRKDGFCLPSQWSANSQDYDQGMEHQGKMEW